MNRASETDGNKSINICTMYNVSSFSQRKRRERRIHVEIMIINFLNIMKNNNLHIKKLNKK